MAGAGDDTLNGQKLVRRTLTNLPAQAINCDDGNRAALIRRCCRASAFPPCCRCPSLCSTGWALTMTNRPN
jgi:hypothetical protein